VKLADDRGGAASPHEDPPRLEPLLGPAEVAELLGLRGPAAVYELVRARARDTLPAFKIGKYLRFRRSELVAWVERQRLRNEREAHS
jgi:excisionase family DNA binding protein